jgi:hypothetical protein
MPQPIFSFNPLDRTWLKRTGSGRFGTWTEVSVLPLSHVRRRFRLGKSSTNPNSGRKRPYFSPPRCCSSRFLRADYLQHCLERKSDWSSDGASILSIVTDTLPSYIPEIKAAISSSCKYTWRTVRFSGKTSNWGYLSRRKSQSPTARAAP